MNQLIAFWQAWYSWFWLQYCPMWEPEYGYYLRMHNKALRELGIEP